MTDEERAEFAAVLRAHRETLLATLAGAASMSQTVTLDQSAVGRLSRMDAMQQQQMAEAQGRVTRRELEAVKHALVRVDNDAYGDCLDCGEEIDRRRLRARPAVTLCVACQREREA
jgi:DnaK suppressor protein